MEIERTRFSDFRPIKLIKGNTNFEQMVCVGLNPPYDRLEAVVQIKKVSGYSGDIRRAPATLL